MDSFGQCLQRAIVAMGISRREFARKVAYSPTSIDKIVHGKRTPPRKHIDRWAKALGSAVDPAVFRELALLAHTPPEIRSEYLRLKELAKRR
jgi:transcriptional regulator with XRE-family HTH domain